MATFHCELAWLGGDEPVADVRVDVAGDRIVAVQAGSPPTGTRLAGLTLPGFANAHSHAFHRALRGRTHAGAGDPPLLIVNSRRELIPADQARRMAARLRLAGAPRQLLLVPGRLHAPHYSPAVLDTSLEFLARRLR